MAELVLFNKPFQVLSQFTDDGVSGGGSPRATLADYLRIPGIYPAGRLDYDSEGLLLLTSEGPLQHRIASPSLKMPKTYWVHERWPDPTGKSHQNSRPCSLAQGSAGAPSRNSSHQLD